MSLGIHLLDKTSFVLKYVVVEKDYLEKTNFFPRENKFHPDSRFSFIRYRAVHNQFR